MCVDRRFNFSAQSTECVTCPRIKTGQLLDVRADSLLTTWSDSRRPLILFWHAASVLIRTNVRSRKALPKLNVWSSCELTLLL